MIIKFASSPDKLVGKSTYKTLHCGGNLRLKNVEPYSVVVTEYITYGAAKGLSGGCIPEIDLRFDYVTKNKLTIAFSTSSDDPDGEGTLKRS